MDRPESGHALHRPTGHLCIRVQSHAHLVELAQWALGRHPRTIAKRCRLDAVVLRLAAARTCRRSGHHGSVLLPPRRSRIGLGK